MPGLVACGERGESWCAGVLGAVQSPVTVSHPAIIQMTHMGPAARYSRYSRYSPFCSTGRYEDNSVALSICNIGTGECFNKTVPENKPGWCVTLCHVVSRFVTTRDCCCGVRLLYRPHLTPPPCSSPALSGRWWYVHLFDCSHWCFKYR